MHYSWERKSEWLGAVGNGCIIVMVHMYSYPDIEIGRQNYRRAFTMHVSKLNNDGLFILYTFLLYLFLFMKEYYTSLYY